MNPILLVQNLVNFEIPVLFMYGLAFFILGMVIFIRLKPRDLKIAKSLPWLALFGIIHGFNEWLSMFTQIYPFLKSNFYFNLVSLTFLATSVFCLLVFGSKFLARMINKRSIFILIPVFLFLWLAFSFLIVPYNSWGQWFTNSGDMSRYFIYFPASIFGGIALIYESVDLKKQKNESLGRIFFYTAVLFFLNAVFAGLVVAPSNFFPANIINVSTFMAVTKIPVQLIRTLLAALIAFSIIRALDVFDFEVERRVIELQVKENTLEKYERIADQLNLILQSTSEGIFEIDTNGRCILLNRAASELTGYKQDEIIGKNFHKLIHNKRSNGLDYAENECPIIRSYKEGKGFKADNEVFRSKNGRYFPVEYSAYPLIENQVIKGSVITFIDITERKRAQDTVSRQAYHDILTKLANRRLFNDRLTIQLAQVNRYGGKLALLFMDIDHFKQVNDSLGHEVGDKLLVEFANRLKNILRESETVARSGGDEFLVLIPKVENDDSMSIMAKRILSIIRERFNIEGNEINITTSIGIAFYPDDGKNRNELIANADAAMYYAKQNGRDRYQFYKEIKPLERQKLLKRERKAA